MDERGHARLPEEDTHQILPISTHTQGSIRTHHPTRSRAPSASQAFFPSKKRANSGAAKWCTATKPTVEMRRVCRWSGRWSGRIAAMDALVVPFPRFVLLIRIANRISPEFHSLTGPVPAVEWTTDSPSDWIDELATTCKPPFANTSDYTCLLARRRRYCPLIMDSHFYSSSHPQPRPNPHQVSPEER